MRGDSVDFDTTSISSNGGNSGGGGTIFNTATSGDIASSGAFSISSTGGTSGGSITLFAGSGNVTINGNINASATGQNGDGKTISITAGDAKSATLSGSILAEGKGSGNGGNVSIVGGSVVGAGSTISTNGGTTGTGGNIEITSAGGVIQLVNNASLTSTGGAEGGTASLFSTSDNLNFAGTINTSGNGDNSKGGTIFIGSAADKVVEIVGTLVTDGTGTRDGGDILVDGGTIQINGARLQSNAIGDGFGGNIGIVVHGQNGLTIGDQTRLLTNGSTEDQIGTITLFATGHPVVVEGNVELAGWLRADGSIVSISSTAENMILSVSAITSTSENTILTLTNRGTRIDVFSSAGAAIVSAGDAILQADSLNVGILNGSNSGTIRNGFVFAENVSMLTNAESNGDIRLGSDVLANDSAGNISITAHGNGSIRSFTGRLRAHSINLSTINGSMVGDGGELDIAVWTDQITANSATNATNSGISIRQDGLSINDTRTLNVNGAFGTHFVSVIGVGDLNINSAVRGGPAGVDLETATGDIKIGAAIVSAGPGPVSITAGTGPGASGNIIQTQADALIVGRSLSVGARDGDVGSPSNFLQFFGRGDEPPTISASPGFPTQDCYVNQVNPEATSITLGPSQVSGNFWLTTSGSIIQDAGTAVTANNLLLRSTGGGNIGTGPNIQSIHVSVNSMTLQTNGSGAVFVTNSESPGGGFGSGSLLLLPSTSGGPFHVQTQNGLQIAGVTANGTITLITNNNVLNVLSGALISGSPTVNLQVLNVASTSGIQIDPFAKVTATAPLNAAVHIYMGQIPGIGLSPIEWTNISLTRSNNGQIIFGGSGVLAAAPTNFIESVGGLVILQPATRPASSFILGGGVQITAKSDAPPILPRGSAPPPGQGGKPPGTSAPPPGKTNAPGQTGTLPPGKTGTGPPGQTGGSPGLQLPPPGQNGNTSPSQGIPIPQGQLNRLKSSADEPDSFSPAEDDDLHKEKYVPVGFISPLSVHGASGLIKEETGPCTIFYRELAVPKAFYHSNLMVAENGTMLIRAKRRMMLRVGKTSMTLAENTMIWMTINRNNLIVRCLDDHHADSVSLSADQWTAKLSAGQELVVGAVKYKEQVPHRQSICYTLHDGTDLVSSEFSLNSLLAVDPILILLRASQCKSEQRSLQRVMKLAACLQLTTAGHGPYTNGIR